MRRWLVESFGNPTEVWRLQEDAESFEPESDQLKIDVEAAGLGLPDVLMCNNDYPLTPPLPFTPSQEAAGKVVAVGANVDKRLVGTRVLGPTLFQAQRGGLAQSCLMHAAGALPIPDAMSGVEAAGFFIPYQTAWVALVRRANITADDTVLILGASGSSGAAAVQLAKAKGARVIAVAGGPEKAAFCARIGADTVIDRKKQDVTATARELTDGKGVSLVFDPVGGKAGRAAFKALAFEGRFLVIGYASGEWAHINLVETLMKNISLLGAMPVGYTPQQVLAAHEDLVKHWRDGSLKVASPQTFDFDDARSAIEHIAAGKVEGKVVVKL
ncbi:MAG: NADPH:quinone oxidoreductase family protein [Halioglobus sp.]|nr:NADPH:quinone oxidoreductase family protein [Halioglobus sp.]